MIQKLNNNTTNTLWANLHDEHRYKNSAKFYWIKFHSTLKGSYTMNKWDLSLRYVVNIYKSTNVISHTDRMKDEVI